MRSARGICLALVAIVVAAISAKTAMQILSSGGIATDFRVFWTAVRSAHPYQPAIWPFAYPPTMLLWIQPLRLGPLWPTFAIWTALSVAVYAATIRPLVGRLWPAALLSVPGVMAGLTGQVSFLVAALVFLAFQTRWTGLLLGIAFTIKPQLVFLAPLAFLVIRDWRALNWFAGTLLFMATLSILVFGIQSWIDWLVSLEHLDERAASLGVLNAAVSPASVAEFLGLPALPFLLAGIALGCATLIRGFEKSEERASVLVLSCLLASPYALSYDLLAIMPLVINHLARRFDYLTIAAMMVLAAFYEVIGLVALAAGLIMRPSRGAGDIDRG